MRKNLNKDGNSESGISIGPGTYIRKRAMQNDEMQQKDKQEAKAKAKAKIKCKRLIEGTDIRNKARDQAEIKVKEKQ
eukprot:15668947-Heterocapsa_arctica.AAC.1